MIEQEKVKNLMRGLSDDSLRRGSLQVAGVAHVISKLTGDGMHPFNYTLMCSYMQLGNMIAMRDAVPEMHDADRREMAARLENLDASFVMCRELLAETRAAMEVKN